MSVKGCSRKGGTCCWNMRCWKLSVAPPCSAPSATTANSSGAARCACARNQINLYVKQTRQELYFQ